MRPVVSRVFVSAHGNVFMREIAEHLAEARSGIDGEASVVTDELPRAGDDPFDNLVVAPHEFFGLFPAATADVEAAAAHAVGVNTEQSGTPFFERAMHFARRGPVVFDINPSSLASVRRLGLAAVHLPLGYVPSMDHWRGRAEPRGVDLAMLAGRTPRRERFLGGAASQLWEWRTDLRIFSWHRPILGGATSFLAGDEKYDALADTRILLNVHRSEEPYFEWARVIEAAANGCVVVSETSSGIAPFVAGEHFVEAPLEYLAEQAVALAFDERRRARIAAAAHEVLTGSLDQRLLLERALRDARTAASAGSPTVTHSSSRGTVVASSATAAATRILSAAKRALLPSTAAHDAETEALQATASRLKQTYLAQLAHTRSIERTLMIARHGVPDPVSTTTTSAWDAFAPTVSVVVPLFDQGRYLRDAVASVIAAASGAAAQTELIIVDDHSADDSAAVAQAVLDEHPWFPIALLRRAANGGLPVARNTGFTAARAPYVFALDADNLLAPSGLRTLVDRLADAAPEVVAVYGILERFDERGAVGVTSHLAWDVDLLVQGAYIDAMALFRRDRWLELGGYADSTAAYGWEDYDLWLRAAERGWRAELVSQFVGRYREQSGSMRKISDIDMATNFVALRERHPRLPWPS
jgi:GT2 family glycosyltransferase